MRLDVNFVAPIDWKKESSVDPRFLTVCGFVVALIVLCGLYFSLSVKAEGLQEDCDQLEKELVVPEKNAVNIRKFIADNTFVNKQLESQLKYRSDHRVSFSRYLMALYQIVPDNMFIASLELSSTRLNPNPRAPLKKGANYKIRYDLIIEGYMLGADAKKLKESISVFPKRIDEAFAEVKKAFPSHPKVEASLNSGVSPIASTNDKQGQKFIINCRFDAI